MKNMLFVFAALIMMGHVTFANIDAPASGTGMAIVKDGTTFKVFYKGAKASDVKVSIINEKNEVVFTETIRKVDGFVRPYNFSTMEHGQYSIELKSDDIHQIEKVTNGLHKIEKLATLIRLADDKDKYLLTVSNKGSNVLRIKIRDENANLVYDQTETVNGDFARIYNFGKLKGNFILEISDKDGVSKTLSF